VVGVVALSNELTPTPPNPTAKASAAAPPSIAIVFFIPVIEVSSHFKHLRIGNGAPIRLVQQRRLGQGCLYVTVFTV
jgi:hypothetical protein